MFQPFLGTTYKGDESVLTSYLGAQERAALAGTSIRARQMAGLSPGEIRKAHFSSILRAARESKDLGDIWLFFAQFPKSVAWARSREAAEAAYLSLRDLNFMEELRLMFLTVRGWRHKWLFQLIIDLPMAMFKPPLPEISRPELHELFLHEGMEFDPRPLKAIRSKLPELLVFPTLKILDAFGKKGLLRLLMSPLPGERDEDFDYGEDPNNAPSLEDLNLKPWEETQFENILDRVLTAAAAERGHIDIIPLKHLFGAVPDLINTIWRRDSSIDDDFCDTLLGHAACGEVWGPVRRDGKIRVLNFLFSTMPSHSTIEHAITYATWAYGVVDPDFLTACARHIQWLTELAAKRSPRTTGTQKKRKHDD